ncbi:MAG: NAD(P)H-dependent oxidoreductase [Pseudomonadota bacterium]|uniref:NAD(P)H-dependent oxidoreductase n=1 Tax=unclassified Phenylobacterium TaxID=2640670 RepID=UPI00070108F9|nr:MULTISPECIES: NAD(P)H-dependent oxidoreductase [unclassified Phenylobacterium]KRB52682.1 NAD(P)H dehydrogenase [Phenylobacterium sp. Root700]MBT9471934.1 NAD(P)H-dependent oxidoreductase [Phenylobacterium sp.]
MRHAVILAHPKPASFCASIAKTCVENLTSLGDQVLLRNLYELGFDPCLKAGELPNDLGFAPEPDVVAERALLADIDSFIFVYPFWFNAPPAILKGYVDRVFGMGFGYGPAFGGTEPLLVGKRLTSFSTSGAPEHWVNSTGALKALMAVFDLHLAGVCGLSVQGHRHFGSILSNLTEEAGADMLSQVEATLTHAFANMRPGLRKPT